MRSFFAVSAAAVASLIACAACTTATHGTGTLAGSLPTALPTVAGSSASASNAGLDARTLERDAVAAIQVATSFEVAAVETDSGQQFGFDIHYGATSMSGTLTEAGQTVQLILVGSTLYMKASSSFWKQQLPQTDQGLVQQIGSKWIQLPATGSAAAGLIDPVSKSTMVAQLQTHDTTDTFVLGPSAVVNGVRCVSFRDTTTGSSVYVAADGTPYPVEVVSGSATGSGTETYSGWNVPFTPTAPPAGQIFLLPS